MGSQVPGQKNGRHQGLTVCRVETHSQQADIPLGRRPSLWLFKTSYPGKKTTSQLGLHLADPAQSTHGWACHTTLESAAGHVPLSLGTSLSRAEWGGCADQFLMIGASCVGAEPPSSSFLSYEPLNEPEEADLPSTVPSPSGEGRLICQVQHPRVVRLLGLVPPLTSHYLPEAHKQPHTATCHSPYICSWLVSKLQCAWPILTCPGGFTQVTQGAGVCNLLPITCSPAGCGFPSGMDWISDPVFESILELGKDRLISCAQHVFME